MTKQKEWFIFRHFSPESCHDFLAKSCPMDWGELIEFADADFARKTCAVAPSLADFAHGDLQGLHFLHGGTACAARRLDDVPPFGARFIPDRTRPWIISHHVSPQPSCIAHRLDAIACQLAEAVLGAPIARFMVPMRGNRAVEPGHDCRGTQPLLISPA